VIVASSRKPRSFAAAGVAGTSGADSGDGPDLAVASTPLPPALLGVGVGTDPVGVGQAVLVGVGLAVLVGVGQVVLVGAVLAGTAGKLVATTAGA